MWSVDHLDGGGRGARGLYVANWGLCGTTWVWWEESISGGGGEEVDRALGMEQVGGPGIQ